MPTLLLDVFGSIAEHRGRYSGVLFVGKVNGGHRVNMPQESVEGGSAMRCFIFALAMVIGSAGQAAYAQQASQQIGLFRMTLAKFESSEAPRMSRPATRLQACLSQGDGGNPNRVGAS